MTTTVPESVSREMVQLLRQVLAKGGWSPQTETRLRDAVQLFECGGDPTTVRLRELIKLALANADWSAPEEAQLRKAAAVFVEAPYQGAR
jgi:hypothetical protein